MLTRILLASTLLAPTLISGSALPREASTQLIKRQNGDFNISFGDDAGSFSSDIPLICVEGCRPALTNFYGCTLDIGSDGNSSSSDSNSTTSTTSQGPLSGRALSDQPTKQMFCNWLCDEKSGNYTGFTQCMNCVIANGEQDVTKADENQKLQKANDVCKGKVQTPITEVTASPTVTGPFQTSFTEKTLTLPTWTGLESYVAKQSGDAFPASDGASEIGGAPSGSSGSPSSSTSSAAPSSSSSGAALSVYAADNGLATVGGVMAALAGLLMI